MDNNICKFILPNYPEDNINIINFVYEKNCQFFEKLRTSAVYSMNLVTDGEGIFSFRGKHYNIKKGDLFFVFPAVPYEIISENDLKYIYISFLGLRATKIMEDFKITKSTPYYCGFANIIELWKSAVETARGGNIDIMSEGLLLYTLSLIGKMACEDKKKESVGIINEIRKYIDGNFADRFLSLASVANHFSYNEKYISSIFKKKMNIGFCRYLNIVRIQNSCALMDEGYTCIKDISGMCGFSDQMYFSKVFKKQLGISPSEYIKGAANRK